MTIVRSTAYAKDEIGMLLYQWVKVISQDFQKSILLHAHTSSNERDIGGKGRKLSQAQSHLQISLHQAIKLAFLCAAEQPRDVAREAPHHQRCANSVDRSVAKLCLVSYSICKLSKKFTMSANQPSAARTSSAPLKIRGFIYWNPIRTSSKTFAHRGKCSTSASNDLA
ncbi:hypothetical protein F511_25574 [Dorcoceras hygrometricum]|uniref:Uncharacterized protein n=1 Tax=Dorcoceras hygrometricum TaxID=472368 RepID=A0A2Z7C440_9LAMI|nr:hypothetical protein F511_25574 [Dorcoceras hygrometricum]